VRATHPEDREVNWAETDLSVELSKKRGAAARRSARLQIRPIARGQLSRSHPALQPAIRDPILVVLAGR